MRRKIDNRIRTLIENGVIAGHRSMFVVVGEKARDQVVLLHHILSNAQVRARPTSVLWCYKKELGFSTHKGKLQRLLTKKRKQGITDNQGDDPFDLFVLGSNIRWCYYRESHNILGNTFDMLVLQDFEAVTPNVLARTIETVQGGGLVILLLNTLTSLKQLYTLTMDVHDRFRTESHQDIVGRFNERFILSLSSCPTCVVVDDKLNVLPFSTHINKLEPLPKPTAEETVNVELKALCESLADTQPAGALVGLCKTVDQAQAVLTFIKALTEKSLRSTVSLTAARGRGKSAALGLAIVGAIGFSYSNIFVTSPSPENLKTLFEFVIQGLNAIHYQEHLDYEVIHSTNPEFSKAIVKINVFKDHRQTIQYIHPAEIQKNRVLGHAAELVVIDEAAAIPLPIVRSLLGPYVIFMASTINGYEGTGRSLSLKLLKELESSATVKDKEVSGRTLSKITLNESIRYKNGDEVEQWLNQLLCLDAGPKSTPIGCPLPDECELYYINRDTLFSFHKGAEKFLQKIMALYVASHYKNSPNDLQMMSDAPSHHLFCLLPPMSETAKAHGHLPEVLCLIQVCLEGQISKESIINSLSRGKRAAGDLIPWTVSQQFQDSQFASLSGARVVRIATNPNYQRKGYGRIALRILEQYYKGHFNTDLDESRTTATATTDRNEDEEPSDEIAPRKSLRSSPLLLKLSERKAEPLDYVGVSYGVTSELFGFWKSGGYCPVYVRQTPNELTGEHSCIMLKALCEERPESAMRQKLFDTTSWMVGFWLDFQRRFISLLGFQFAKFPASLALNILTTNLDIESERIKQLNRAELDLFITLYDLKRLEMYSQNMVDYHLIVDLLPNLARLYFSGKMGGTHLSAAQAVILLSFGLQHKEIELIEEELRLPASQILGLFNRAIRKLASYLRDIAEKDIEQSLGLDENTGMAKQATVGLKPLSESLDEELGKEAQKIENSERKRLKELSKEIKGLEHYAIKGTEDQWDKAVNTQNKSLISIKTLQPKRDLDTDGNAFADDQHSAKKKKKFKFGKGDKHRKSH